MEVSSLLNLKFSAKSKVRQFDPQFSKVQNQMMPTYDDGIENSRLNLIYYK